MCYCNNKVDQRIYQLYIRDLQEQPYVCCEENLFHYVRAGVCGTPGPTTVLLVSGSHNQHYLGYGSLGYLLLPGFISSVFVYVCVFIYRYGLS